jgi:hypothetical protein
LSVTKSLVFGIQQSVNPIRSFFLKAGDHMAIRDAVLWAVERWHNFPEFGGYLGNVGLECPCPSLGNLMAPLLPDRQGEEHEPPDNLREHESAKRQLGYKGCHDSAASIIGTSKLSSCLESR